MKSFLVSPSQANLIVAGLHYVGLLLSICQKNDSFISFRVGEVFSILHEHILLRKNIATCVNKRINILSNYNTRAFS